MRTLLSIVFFASLMVEASMANTASTFAVRVKVCEAQPHASRGQLCAIGAMDPNRKEMLVTTNGNEETMLYLSGLLRLGQRISQVVYVSGNILDTKPMQTLVVKRISTTPGGPK